MGVLYSAGCNNSYPSAAPTSFEAATTVALSTSAVAPMIEQTVQPSSASTSVPPPIPNPTVAAGESTVATPATPPALATVIEATSTLGRCNFTLEVANNVAERSLGLMHRAFMPMDHGMLFVFAFEDELSFWMKDTLIPLDIVFFDRTLRVVDIQSMIPEHEITPALLPFYTSAAPAKFALEVNAGAASNCSIKSGDLMNLNYLSN